MTLPGSGLGTTSLGAVGGPRGTAAGALRILVEFLTQYDSKAVKQLEDDLKSLGDQDAATSAKQLAAQRAFETSKKREAETTKQIQKLISTNAEKPSAVRSRLREIEKVGVLSKEGQRRLSLLSKELAGNNQLLVLETRRARLRATMLGSKTKEVALTTQQVAREEVIAQKQTQLSAFQKLKGGLGPKLGGLALGALGGIVGGAVLGVGFAAAEAVLDKVATAIQDIIDPARHAREQVGALADAINELASSEANQGDRLKGAQEFLKNIGIDADEQTAQLLARAAATGEVAKQLEKLGTIEEVIRHIDELEKGNRDKRIDQLIEEAKHRGDLKTVTFNSGRAIGLVADRAYYAAQAEAELTDITGQSERAMRAAADAAAILEAQQRAAAASAQLLAFAEENLVSAINNAAGKQIGGIDAKISGLQNAGDSARTKGLEAQIQRLQDAASGGGGNSQELANIAEERALILLRQRLRLMGTAINLEKYSGKFLLEAINAKLAALQKEAAQQDRLNKLLDLQYRMSQKLRRNEGESISDFLERRAQENRGFLSEQRDLEREQVEERLNELRDKTQDEVALADLAQRKQNALSKSGTDSRIRDLQRALEASRENDRKTTQAKIEALRKQKEALELARDNAIKFSAQEYNEKVRLAISAANTVSKLAVLGGQISGLSAARNFLSALAQSGAITGPELTAMLQAIERIDATINKYDNQLHKLGRDVRSGGRIALASGGLIRLNNASSPFGANVKFGEQGDEMGLILQNKVAQGLKETMKQTGDLTFYLERGDDWLRDRYEFKRAVREGVREALG